MRARFDFGRNQGVPPVLFHSPERVVTARTVDEVRRAMEEVERGLREGLHAAGWVSYEAAPAFDSALQTQAPSDVPLVCFGLFRRAEPALPLGEEAPPAPVHWTPVLPADAYARGVATVREAIAAGDTYQINYTFRLRADLPGQDLYGALALSSEVPYAACIEAFDWHVLSVSPELFFERDGHRLITRPMKGTAPRGRWAEEDAARRETLATSEKNRAENVMIVDLCRNDLSRVCDIGSVRATSLFDVEAYPTVWQMVSTVEGETRAGTRLTDVFAALFPAGSITGAPKSSSMRLIAQLEHAPRGVYCGAIGYASPDGRAIFNVAIRTITVHTPTGRAEYGVGGGITWDSNPADEHAEALSKAAVLDARPPFRLIETLRSEGGRLIRFDRHLDRLRESAAWFGFACDPARVRALVEAHASSFGSETRRLRLLLNREGHAAVQSEALPAAATGHVGRDLPPSLKLWRTRRSLGEGGQVRRPQKVGLAADPVDSRDQFLCHKTTRRDVYERHGAEHPDMFDVLLWNERNELTECTRANLVVELDGVRWTPDRRSGLLAGVFRAELLEAGVIEERVLLVDDLARATRLWCINSLREWVEVRLSRTPGP